MDALIDVNVIMNFVSGRDDPHGEASVQVLNECADRRFVGLLAFHSLSVLWYVVKRQGGEELARFWIEHLCGIMTVVGASQEHILQAIRNRQFKDFEDCLQDECASNAGADYLVTCNARDYGRAKTKVVTPSEFLQILLQTNP